MIRQLNGVEPDYARRELESVPGSIDKRLAGYSATAPDDYKALSKHAFVLVRLYKEVGTFRHLLGQEPSQVSPALRSAATWTAKLYDAYAKGNLHADSVWTLHLCALGIVTAFGTPEDRRTMSTVSARTAVRNAEIEPASGEASVIWQSFLAHNELAEATTRKLLVSCEAENAARRDRQWVHGIARSLLGIAGKSREELDAGLEETLAYHKYEATRGGWKLDTNGILSVVALGVMRLALEAGLETQVRSEYAPLELLKVK